MQHNVLILDFGSQYTQLIARRVRELNIFCEIYPYNNYPTDLSAYKAIILGGSPYSVRSEDALQIDLSEIRGKIPLLAVCYGAQYLAHFSGGEVAASNIREYGRANLSYIKEEEDFLADVALNSQVWMSHSDTIKSLPTNGIRLASTKDVENAAYRIEGETTYAIQFHPEVYHSVDGKQILENFLVKIAKVEQSFTPNAFVEDCVKELQEKVGNDRVVLGLSGGVDSTVAAVLLNKAIGKNLYCIFVNNGLLRKNEFENVLLTNHKKLNKWLQLGGHWCDFESEPNQFILDCAIKEVEEEAFGDKKIEQEILFNNNAVDLDIHSVGSHFHYDICFASIVKKTIPIVVSNESLDVKWLNIDMVLENNYELRLNYLVLKNEDSCFIGHSPRLLG